MVSVSRKSVAGAGRFNGLMWIEDKGFNIVRFNGTYGGSKTNNTYLHFDSWRVNCGPGLWVPYQIYSEETERRGFYPHAIMHYKAITQLWDGVRVPNSAIRRSSPI